MLLGSGGMAVAVSLVLFVQSVASFSPLSLTATQSAPSTSKVFTPQPVRVYGVSVNPSLNLARISMLPFTSDSSASAFGAQYGMQLLASYRSFGWFDFSLPQVRVKPGTVPNTAIVFFPPRAAASDIASFLTANGLTVRSWISSSDVDGRTADVAYPLIRVNSFNPYTGVYQATITPAIPTDKFLGWSGANGLTILGYDLVTVSILIQGRPTLIRRPASIGATVITHVTLPATTK